MDAQQILTDGATAALFSNIITNLFKWSPVPTSPWPLRVAAFATAEAVAFVLFAANGGEFTGQNIAITSLVGVAAMAGAMLTKGISNKAEEEGQ